MRRSSVALSVCALAAGLAAAWPPLHLVLANVNLSSYYQENIGYRFFWALRLVDGVPGDFVHPGQGVLLSLIQALYYLAGKALGLDLYGQIHLFALLTTAVSAVAMIVVALLIARDAAIDVAVRATLVTTPLIMALGGPQMFSYDTYPDYTAYAKVAFLLFSWRWLHHRGWEGVHSTRAAIELGVLGGLMAALKINYAIWPAFLLLCSFVVMLPAQWCQAIQSGVLIAACGSLAWALCLLLHYHGHPSLIVRFFRVVLGWSTALSGTPNFSIRLIPPSETLFPVGGPATGDPHASEVTLGWLIVIFAVACILALALAIRMRAFKSIVAVVTTMILGSIAVYMDYLRGGGSSYFEAVVMLTFLCVLVLAAVASEPARRYASFALAAIFIVWPAAWTLASWRVYQTVAVTGHQSLLKLTGDWQRKLYDWNRSHGLPIYVLTPTNYYSQGTVEDMMNLGFTNFPNHTNDSNDNPTRKVLFPQYKFLYFSDVKPFPDYKMTLPPGRVVFMQVLGRPVPDYPQLDPKLAERHKREVDALLAGRKREQCYTVDQPQTHMNIESCVLGGP